MGCRDTWIPHTAIYWMGSHSIGGLILTSLTTSCSLTGLRPFPTVLKEVVTVIATAVTLLAVYLSSHPAS
ncbi:hypothetical protein GJAV_G00118530 [Gymnothorax javanicus]|nr:hypothetical protein GJAV_G00118530 [Gymnothorax javanicus]